MYRELRSFISYRRGDGDGAGRLHDSLRREFGSKNVFRDITDIPPAADFPAELERAIARCDVFVAVLGPHWQAERLANEADFVRRELETAFKCRRPIVPVLLDDVQMPERNVFPEHLESFANINATRVRREEFDSHVRKLIRTMRRVGPWQGRVPRRMVVTAAALAALSVGAYRVAPTLAVKLKVGVASSSPQLVRQLFDKLKALVASQDEFRQVELDVDIVTNAKGFDTFLAADASYDLVTIDEPWIMDAAPSLSNVEELAEAVVRPDAHVQGLLDTCRVGPAHTLVGVPFRFNVLLLLTRLDRLRAAPGRSVTEPPRDFDDYLALIEAARAERSGACPVIFYNEKTNSQAEAFLALYRIKAPAAEGYSPDGPIQLRQAEADACRQQLHRLMQGCLRARGIDQAKELLSEGSGAVIGHCWASWLLNGAGGSERLYRMLEQRELDVTGCSRRPVGGSWMLGVPRPTATNLAKRKVAARVAIFLSTHAECQRLLWEAGLFPALEACWATTDDIMPTWVRETFTTSDASMISMARRTRPRFQTRRWTQKQDALIEYINTGAINDRALVELT